jgi:arginase family enzyme
MAPGTGTPVSGGIFTRELRQLVRLLRNVNLVGADVVEVSPPYDSNGTPRPPFLSLVVINPGLFAGEITALAAAEIVYEILSIMSLNPLYGEPVVAAERPVRPGLGRQTLDVGGRPKDEL